MNKGIVKRVIYVFLMILFLIFAYLFINVGWFSKTKIKVNYYEKSYVNYQVLLKDGNIYTDNNKSYLGDNTDKIKFDFGYENIFSDFLNGFYSYNVIGKIILVNNGNITYMDSYNVISDKFITIDQNNINSIKIEDSFEIDYSNFLLEYLNYISNDDSMGNVYLEVGINFNQVLDFYEFNNESTYNSKISFRIPLTNDLYKIKINNLDRVDSFYEFSSKENINYIFIILGLICFSLGVSLFILVVFVTYNIYIKERKYRRLFNEIISNNSNRLINVKKFYSKKFLNIIYVNDFDSLVDLSIKLNKKISYKVMKVNCKCIFVINDNENAWVYMFTIDEI